MRLEDTPFDVTTWAAVPVVEHPGANGVARWRSCQFGHLRVRMVEYSPGYRADHWCTRGHILLVLEGELVTELSDGTVYTIPAGSSYQVGDDLSAHRSTAPRGARLFGVD